MPGIQPQGGKWPRTRFRGNVREGRRRGRRPTGQAAILDEDVISGVGMLFQQFDLIRQALNRLDVEATNVIDRIVFAGVFEALLERLAAESRHTQSSPLHSRARFEASADINGQQFGAVPGINHSLEFGCLTGGTASLSGAAAGVVCACTLAMATAAIVSGAARAALNAVRRVDS
jgi:hypothetical protein